MITAIDSSVLLSIFNAESEGAPRLESLIDARREGRLIICEIVYAETAPAFEDLESLDDQLETLGISVLPIGRAAAWQAAITFRQYRNQGGPRKHMISDFLIAAHARCQADRLAATDRGCLRRWFSDLKLLAA